MLKYIKKKKKTHFIWFAPLGYVIIAMANPWTGTLAYSYMISCLLTQSFVVVLDKHYKQVFDDRTVVYSLEKQKKNSCP